METKPLLKEKGINTNAELVPYNVATFYVKPDSPLSRPQREDAASRSYQVNPNAPSDWQELLAWLAGEGQLKHKPRPHGNIIYT